MRRTLTTLTILGLLLLPAVAGAVDWLPLVQCGDTAAGQASCTPCDLFATVKRLFDLILYGITGPIAAFMIVLAGGMMLLGGGNPSLYGKGKSMLQDTLVGVTIILVAWAATTFLIKTFIRTGEGDRWYEFSCPASLQTAIPPIETAFPANPANADIPESTYQTKHIGVAAIGQGGGSGEADGTAGAGGLCPAGDCSGKGKCPALARLWNSRPNGALLEYIAWHESACNIGATGKTGDFGLMQLTPATANMFRDGCEVVQERQNCSEVSCRTETVPVEITGAWLKSELNTESVVCIADNYINSLKGSCGNDWFYLVAGYNGGVDECRTNSRDCPDIDSCGGNGKMRKWECLWDNRDHTIQNIGYAVTRNYAAEARACQR